MRRECACLGSAFSDSPKPSKAHEKQLDVHKKQLDVYLFIFLLSWGFALVDLVSLVQRAPWGVKVAAKAKAERKATDVLHNGRGRPSLRRK